MGEIKAGIYTFPRCGRGWLAMNLRKQGLHVSFCQDKDFETPNIVMDHEATPDSYPNRKSISVARDPVYSIFSWHELNVNRCDQPDTLESFEDTVRRGVSWWKDIADMWLDNPSAYVVRYVDMLEDIHPVIRGICEYIGAEYKDVPLEQARNVRKLEDGKFYTPDVVRDMISRMEPQYSRMGQKYGW